MSNRFRMMSLMGALTLLACGPTELDDSETPPTAPAAEEEVGEQSQELKVGYCRDNRTQFAFAECDGSIAVYGCKWRNSGKVIWDKKDLCWPCMDKGTSLACGLVGAPK